MDEDERSGPVIRRNVLLYF